MPASTAITLALVFYTIGVFGERRAGTLKKSHLALFWLGLICDTTGTTIMTTIARTSTAAVSPLHAITGLLAIIFMLSMPCGQRLLPCVAVSRVVGASTS